LGTRRGSRQTVLPRHKAGGDGSRNPEVIFRSVLKRRVMVVFDTGIPGARNTRRSAMTSRSRTWQGGLR